MRQLGECSAWCFADQRGRSQRQPDSDQTLGLSDSQTHMQAQAQAQAPQMPKRQRRCLVSFLHAKKPTPACSSLLLAPPSHSCSSLLTTCSHLLLSLVTLLAVIIHVTFTLCLSRRPALLHSVFVSSGPPAPCQTQAKMGQSSQTPASTTKRRLASNRHPIFLALIDERSAPP